MWKEILLVGFASVVLQTAEAHGGAESLSFHGFLPIENIKAKKPRGDNQPNDVYLHLERRPVLRDDEDAYYPPNLAGFGLEHGQDPEQRVYQVYRKQEVEELRRQQQSKFGKHGKGGHSKGHNKGGHSKGGHSKASHSKPVPPPPSPIHHSGQPSHPPPPPPPHFHRSHERINYPSSHERHNSYPSPPPPQYRPKPSFPPPLPHHG